VLGLARLGQGADLLHANDVRAALWCQLAAPLARRPWTWHVRDLLQGAHRFERAARWLRPARLVAISGAVKRQLLAYGPWDPGRVDVVLNGVDPDALAAAGDRAAWRREMRLADDQVAVGIVGRLVSWKGQDDFLRAAALAAPRAPSARFFVVGDAIMDAYTARQAGDERARLEALAAELGIAERVTFTGHRPDVASVMAGLDLLVLASHAEPFGRVLLEAMSVGTAVVATAAGGAEEVVVHGESGLLVPPRQPEALAAAMQALLDDPARRRAFGATGRERVRRCFSLDRLVDHLLQVWRRAACASL
jgi:glycosyltransferase involved in cell wall biosynthesis